MVRRDFLKMLGGMMGLSQFTRIMGREAVLSGQTFFPDLVSAHLLLPGLRGFWPMSSIDETGLVYDLSGQGNHLTNNNGATFGVTGRHVPYVEFDGVNQSLSRTDDDGLDVSPNITVGCWVNMDVFAKMGLISKNGGSGNRSYLLQVWDGVPLPWAATGWLMNMSVGGVNFVAAAPSVGTKPPVLGTWYHVVGRHDVNDFHVFINGVKSYRAAGNSGIYNSAADFVIGDTTDSGGALDGRVALPFVCASSLPDELILWLYQYGAGLMVN